MSLLENPLLVYNFSFAVFPIFFLRRSTNRSIFWLLHKSGNADEPSYAPSIETNSSRKEQRLESTASGVRLPISAFLSMSWPVLRNTAKHCHAGELLCRVSLGTVSVSSAMLGSNALNAFDIDSLWWFHSVSTAYNTSHQAVPTKCRA